MPLLAWSRWQLMIFWIAALAASVACLIIGRFRSAASWEFAFLLPYDGTVRSMIRVTTVIVRYAFVERPWEATAFIGIPIVTIAVSTWWLAVHALAHRAG